MGNSWRAFRTIPEKHSVSTVSPQEIILQTAARSWAQSHELRTDSAYIRTPSGKHETTNMSNICYSTKWVADVSQNDQEKESTLKPIIINTKNIFKVFLVPYNYSNTIYCVMSKWESKWNYGIIQIFQLSSLASEIHSIPLQEIEILF